MQSSGYQPLISVDKTESQFFLDTSRSRSQSEALNLCVSRCKEGAKQSGLAILSVTPRLRGMTIFKKHCGSKMFRFKLKREAVGIESTSIVAGVDTVSDIVYVCSCCDYIE